MIHDLSSVNPLLLLQSSKIARLQNAFVQMDPIRNGEAASDLVIALNNLSSRRLNLCLVKQVSMKQDNLLAEHVSLISSAPCNDGCDHLIIENQKWMSSSAQQFASQLRKSGWKMANDHLKFTLLRIRLHDLRHQLSEGGKVARNYNKCQSEMIRRFSVGLATFTFTLMGVTFGMEISRNRSKRGVLLALLLTTSSLIAFCIGKAMGHLVWIAAICLLVPHCMIILTSLLTLNRINKGVE